MLIILKLMDLGIISMDIAQVRYEKLWHIKSSNHRVEKIMFVIEHLDIVQAEIRIYDSVDRESGECIETDIITYEK